ncbi:hypothetical protein LTR16_003742 [Cryomyces antarcticus]|uniref:Uncharacterized protein n=1 Tax=Cryomyces antarcticus TaxID=329879 RepID=A0ABR0KSA6_9PEZI|nr:hypothetical protein LTR16_003742 [Cryomyces antarcticus]KAK5158595.1 hypothetical protein LTR04_005216 [Oleoguttula sp. CCFEE 6159]
MRPSLLLERSLALRSLQPLTTIPPTRLIAVQAAPFSITHRPSSSQDSQLSPAKPIPAQLSPRWLGELKQRIGKCILFGLRPEQTARAGTMLQEMAQDWRELLAGRHVNNVTYNRYAESARITWAQKYARNIDPAHQEAWSELWTPKGDGLILRSIKTDFKFPMTWPDHITVYHKLATAPTSQTDSFVLDVLILSELHQRPAARCLEDIVVYNYRSGKKTPLRPFMVDAFRETWALQEEVKRRNSARIEKLFQGVRELEVGSWDRADAKEDLGSAGA